MSKAAVMPWSRDAADIEAARGLMDALRAQPDHTIAEDAYIAPGADVYTETLDLGENSWIAAHTLIRGRVKIGADCSVNPRVHICGQVQIGDGVRIASLVTIVGFNHGIDDVTRPIHGQPGSSHGITIGEDVWIGANAVICDGVTVGAHSVIAAGAVVVKDVPEYSIVGGNPARVIRDRRKVRKPSVEQALEHLGERAAAEWRAVLKSAEAEVDGDRIYLDHQRGVPTVRAWCDAVEIARFFDSTPALENREQLIARLQSYQEPQYGLILSPGQTAPERKDLVTLPEGYHFLAVGYALECLGSHVPRRITALDEISCEELYDHLENLPWNVNGWGCGSWIDVYSTALYHNLHYHEANNRPEWLFGWITTHCNPATGLWSPPNPDKKWLLPVNGFYRLTRGTYAQFGQPLPYPESSIDTILSHCRHYGNFLEHHVTACNVLDIVHPLWLCSRQTDYRADEIRAIMEAQILAITQRWIENRGFSFAPEEVEPGLQGTEMWLSILAIAADYLGLGNRLGYRPHGVHRLEPAHPLG